MYQLKKTPCMTNHNTWILILKISHLDFTSGFLTWISQWQSGPRAPSPAGMSWAPSSCSCDHKSQSETPITSHNRVHLGLDHPLPFGWRIILRSDVFAFFGAFDISGSIGAAPTSDSVSLFSENLHALDMSKLCNPVEKNFIPAFCSHWPTESWPGAASQIRLLP